ncbi:MAG: type II toxin-antitoxin system YafQ family toxin [Pseudomonadota bacterium]
MRQAYFTNRFKKDVKRQNKRRKNLSKLSDLIDHVCEFGDAPDHCKPRNLVGNWAGYRECHIESDWLLIFTIEDDTATFHRTGTHSDLFR